MKRKCYHVVLKGSDYVYLDVIFIKRPKYTELFRVASNEAKKILAADRESIRAELDALGEAVTALILPLFKDNPDGNAIMDKNFPHHKNRIGELRIGVLRLV